MGFFRGLFAPFRGGLYVLRHPVKRYLVVPFVLSIVLATASMIAARRYWSQELASMVSSSPVLGGFFLAIMTGVGGVVLFLIAQPLLLSVFADSLSERVERAVVGTAPTVPLLTSTGRALVHGLLKLVLYGIALVVGLGLTAVTGGLGSLIGIALGGLSLAYDGFDYPLARRGVSFGGKWAFLARNPGLTIGYGVGATVLYLIPFAVFVAAPFAAVGATLAYIDTEKPAPAAATPAKPSNVAANS
ncbi:MAG TPA: EI24 domain-containing protein [Polyangia bacterium]|nr:EI24 domain-containing protein [Polyangia bacterium]